MTFRVMKTSDAAADGPSKVLLYAHHGFGKTYQTRHYQKRYGPGLILSGEAGLRSVGDVDIDYLPFSSWDGKHDPDEGIYSFRGIMNMIAKEDLRTWPYKWIAIDSLTELSERLIEHLEKEHKGSTNQFAMWADYSRLMLGALKYVRDMPVHVYVSCLAKEESDDNGNTNYWPLVKGTAVSKHIPSLFDHVFCGVRTTEKNEQGTPKVKRYFVTEEVNGWHGKVRDPLHRLKPYEASEDITELLTRMTSKE